MAWHGTELVIFLQMVTISIGSFVVLLSSSLKSPPPLLQLRCRLWAQSKRQQYIHISSTTSTTPKSVSLLTNWGSKKVRQKRLQSFRMNMDPKLEEILAPLRISVKEQVRGGDHSIWK